MLNLQRERLQNWKKTIDDLEEKLAQAKEENVGLHQTLDQTLNELNCI